MFYVGDQHNAPQVLRKIRQKNQKAVLGDEVKEVKMEDSDIRKGTDDAWYLVGATIGNKFDQVKELLSEYDYEVDTQEDAIIVISKMFATEDWLDFLEDMQGLMVNTAEKIDKGTPDLPASGEESGFVVTAIVGGVTALLGVVGTAIKGSQAKKLEEQRAQDAMLQGMLDIHKVREEKKKRTGTIIAIAISLVIIIGLIMFAIYMSKRKKQ